MVKKQKLQIKKGNLSKKEEYPQVSFVICTLNCKDYLELCLKSIRNQDYNQKNVEIIIVDSYSTDGTLEVAKKYNSKIILTKIKGYMEGRGMPKSIGCENASGEFIFTLDSDNSLVEKDWIKKMIFPHMDDSSIDYSICRMAVVKKDNLVNQYLSLVGTDPFAIYASLDPQISLGNVELINREGYKIYNNRKENFLITGGYYLCFKKTKLVEMGGYSRDVDVAYTLASKKEGANIAVVFDAHLHHLITKGFYDFINKKIKWGKYYFNKGAEGDRVFNWNNGLFGKYGRLNFYLQIARCLFVVPSLLESLYMLIKSKEKAWILHAPLTFITPLLYLYPFVKIKLNFSRHK